MDPVLIYTDTTRIQREKDFLDRFVPVFQSVYTAIKATGVTPTISEINTLVGHTRTGNGAPNFVQEFIINKLLDAAAPYNFSGVTFTREAVRGMIVQPDVSAIITALNAAKAISIANLNGVRIDLLTLTADVIAKAETADDTITSEFTYYTKSDASATLAGSLQGICDVLNTHDGNYNQVISRNLIGFSDGTVDTAIKGIAFIGNTFRPSLSFIRQFEAGQA